MKNNIFLPTAKNISSKHLTIYVIIAVLSLATAAALIIPKTSQAACADTPDSSKGTATMSVSVPETTKYKVWTRLLVPDSTNNSYFLQIDGGCAIRVGGNSGIAANNWTWVSYKDGSTSSTISVDLTAGQHQLVLTGRDTGVGVDRILFLSDMNCTPTGKGDNCTATTPPPTGDTTPPNTTINGVNVDSVGKATAIFSSSESGSTFECKLDGWANWKACSSPQEYADLESGTRTIEIRAKDKAGNVDQTPASKSFSVPETQSTPAIDKTAPQLTIASPANNSVVSGNTTITANASDNVGVTKVEYYIAYSLRQTDKATPYRFTIDTRQYPNGPLTIGAKTYDAAGNTKGALLTVNIQNPDITPPNAPTSLSAKANSATSVGLSWNASVDGGAIASGVAKYEVLRNGIVIAQPTSTTYTDNETSGSTAYTYTVRAVDVAGNVSTTSNQAKITTPAAPDTSPPTVPSKPKATAVSSSQVNVVWTASTDSGGSGLAGYNIYRNGNKLNSTLLSKTSFGDVTVKAGSSYSYTVEAVDGAGNKSAQTSPMSVNVPSPVSNVIKVSPSDDSSLRKDTPTVNYGTETSYKVDYKPTEDIILKFKVSGINGRPVANAKLRLYVADGNGSKKGGDIYQTRAYDWNQGTVAWGNAPRVEFLPLLSLGSTVGVDYVDADLSKLIKTDGVYSLRIKSTSGNGSYYYSKESPTGPSLIITTLN